MTRAISGRVGEEIGDLCGALGLLAHPDRQRLQPLEQRPGVEGRQARAGVAEIVVQILVDPLLVGKDDAAEAAALAVDVLGRRIDDDMRAELERLLLQRRGEDIVDDQPRADRVGECGDRGDVDHFERRVGRAFEEEQLRVRPDRLFPVRDVGAVDQRRARCRISAPASRSPSGRSRTARAPPRCGRRP